VHTGFNVGFEPCYDRAAMKQLLRRQVKWHQGRLSALAGVCVLLFSCKASIDVPTPGQGSADFTKYVSIGNSLTAGYADGGLYLEGQQNSYPSMIARQLAQLRSGTFVQPLFGGTQFNGSGYLKLDSVSQKGVPVLGKITNNLAIVGYLLDKKTPQLARYSDPVNNLGVPGIKLIQITAPQLAFANPYFERLLATGEIGTTNYQQKVLDSKPTFFTCWLGSNDALLYATAGGTDANNPLTPQNAFASLYGTFISQLLVTGAKGVLCTIPDVTLTPYFTTKTVAAIRTAAAGANKPLPPLYITTGTGAVRAATASDLIVLTVDSIGFKAPTGPKGFSPYNPLRNSEVLDSAEVALTRTAIAGYNQTIASLVTANPGKLGLLNINKVLGQIAQGNYMVDGAKVSLSYITGGVFSLDGIHLTPRGYAIVANEYIKVINTTYGSTVPTFSPALYRTVKLP